MVRQKVNQKSIARDLKLSPATVSKSLRNHPDICPETRARVLEYAAKLGLEITHPPRPRRAVLQTRFVGVLIHDNHGVPEFRDRPAASYLTGLSRAANRMDLSLIVHRFVGESSLILDPANQPSAMRQGGLDGLVLIHRFDAEVVRQLASQRPCVTLTFNVQGAPCDHVDSDHIAAMGLVLEHLHGLGHRQIGYVGHPNKPLNSLARFGAFAQVMARMSLSLDLRNVLNVYGDKLDWAAQGDEVARRLERGVTAWVCSVDTVGYHLWHHLGAKGIRVPQDVSITGYDADEPMLGLPPLTSVQVPFDQMGEFALNRLLQRVEDPGLPRTQTLFECELAPGQSTGRNPSAGGRCS